LASVRSFANEVLTKYTRLDGLMCNAGMVNMKNKPDYTKDGFESTIAVSYFGHFLMTELLLDLLKKSAPARIGILSSVVHANSPKKRYKVHLDDLNYRQRKFNNFDAYGEAKVASVLYAKELAERLKGTGVTTASIHPGWARSNFGGGGGFLMSTLFSILKPIFKILNYSDSSWESSQASLHVLLSDDAPNHSGAYFSQHSILYQDKECKKGGFPMKTPNPNARDMETARQLVAKSYELVGLEKPVAV